nr:beta-arabinofuranosyltransferase RAY1 isoform X2 [Tanacetum cinerariifolium]
MTSRISIVGQHKRCSRKHIAVVRASCSVGCILKVSVTIFAAATTFSGSVGRGQSLAIRSWLGSSQNIRVVLFSQKPSVFSFASSSGMPLAFLLNQISILRKFLIIYLKFAFLLKGVCGYVLKDLRS